MFCPLNCSIKVFWCQNLTNWHFSIRTKIRFGSFSQSDLGLLNQYGDTGCPIFKRAVQNWKDFCLKFNSPKGNYWISRIGVMKHYTNPRNLHYNGEVSKSANIWLSKSILYVKNHRNLSHFFFIQEYQFRSMFLVTDIFW